MHRPKRPLIDVWKQREFRGSTREKQSTPLLLLLLLLRILLYYTSSTILFQLLLQPTKLLQQNCRDGEKLFREAGCFERGKELIPRESGVFREKGVCERERVNRTNKG